MKPNYVLKTEQRTVSFRTSFLNRKVAVSRDGRYVAMAGRLEEEDAFVWELPVNNKNFANNKSTPKELNPKLRPPIRGNNFLEFIGSSYNLMGDGAKIWDVEHNREIVTEGGFRPEAGVRPFLDSYFDHVMALSPDGCLLVGSPLHDAQFNYYNLALWEVASGKLLYRYKDAGDVRPAVGNSSGARGVPNPNPSPKSSFAPKPSFKHNKSQVSFTKDGNHFYQIGVVETEAEAAGANSSQSQERAGAAQSRFTFALFYYSNPFPVREVSASAGASDGGAARTTPHPSEPEFVPVADFSSKSPELPFTFSPDGEVLEIADGYYLLSADGSAPQLFRWEFQSGAANAVKSVELSNREALGFVNKKLVAGKLVLVSPESGELYRTNLAGRLLNAGELLELVYEESSGSIFGFEFGTKSVLKLQPRAFASNPRTSLGRQLIIGGDDNLLLVFQLPSDVSY